MRPQRAVAVMNTDAELNAGFAVFRVRDARIRP